MANKVEAFLRNDLAKDIAKRSGVGLETVQTFLDYMGVSLQEALDNDLVVEFPGIGVFGPSEEAVDAVEQMLEAQRASEAKAKKSTKAKEETTNAAAKKRPSKATSGAGKPAPKKAATKASAAPRRAGTAPAPKAPAKKAAAPTKAAPRRAAKAPAPKARQR